MVKKFANKLKIDFENCIIDNSLLQIKNHKASNEFAVVNAWCLTIPAQASKALIGLVRDYGMRDPVPLRHIKRIRKSGDNELSVIVCSEMFMDSALIKEELDRNRVSYTRLEVKEVPKTCPSTKELALKWSECWPLIWKGNPNDQILNDTQIDPEIVRSHLQHVSRQSNSIKGSLPITTAIVDPKTNKVINTSNDERHFHPLDHSIMRCIQSVALFEQKRRKTSVGDDHQYLCEGYHVYTTHEPCTMCSMALIHSRVSRLIYLKQMAETGGLNPKSGEGYVIQNHKLLNSSFEVWQWLGDEHPVINIDSNVNA